MYKRRFIAARLKKALSAFPVVALLGARQTGKTTLVQNEFPDRPYLSLDDPTVRMSLEDDPFLFLSSQSKPLTIDEAQRCPRIFEAIKRIVDRDRRPGTFLITGSANFLLMKKVTETLAGRVALFELSGFMLSELLNLAPGRYLVDCLMAPEPEGLNPPCVRQRDKKVGTGLPQLIQKGTLPPLALMEDDAMKEMWIDGYVQTYLERDLRELSQVASLVDFRRVMSLCAMRTAQLLNYSDLARDAGISVSSVRNYLNLLVLSYHVRLLPPFYVNLGKRLVKSPKLHFRDTAVAIHLAGLVPSQVMSLAHPFYRALVETYLVEEIIKVVGYLEPKARFYHFRSHGGAEVDLVIQQGERLLPIEIRSSSEIDIRKLKGLKQFLKDFSQQAPLGLVMYPGEKPLRLSNNIVAVPWKSCLVHK